MSLDDCLDFDAQDNPGQEHSMDDLAYIIYTSGSTGLPKGSMLKKRGVANLMHAMCKEIAYDPQQVGVTITTVSFDIFMVDAILPLCAGCRVVVAEEEELRQPTLLARLIEEEDIAFLQATPSRMLMMLRDAYFVQAGKRHLKKIVLGGEKPSPSLIRKVKKSFPGELKNAYGPTETTVWSSFQNLADTTKVSIGYPISNTHFYLLDSYGKPVPIGVIAEAYISGDGVSCGYFGREDLNRKCFTPDPFRPGKTMYRTGDICCFKEDGEILIMGRADNQVKIRGLRIELGEIETQLMRYQGIDDAIVVVWGEDEHKYLCAYYRSSKELDEAAIRKELTGSLPLYMVPSHFIRLDALPMTANGKVDRKALPLPFKSQQDTIEKTTGLGKLPPEQRRLLRVIAKALGLKQVHPSDNFFELGGDSLAVISIQAKMMQYGMSLRTQDFYDAATLAELCENLQNEEREEVLLSTKQQKSRNEIAAQVGLLEAARLSRVLVTGATGFLGAHVVEALSKTGVEEVICLVRGTSQEQAQKRLDETLSFYFGADRPHPRAICADITKDLRDLRDSLMDVDTIINCAAWTDHVGHREDYERINVGSTQNVIDLAVSIGAKLAHVSTVSVSGSSAETFDESSYYIGQNVSDNEYARSKFLAEGIVLDAIGNGLDGRIFRVGNLAGRWEDGFFQKDVRKNAFAMRLAAFISLGQYPQQDGISCEMTPVDLCAKALVRLLGSTVESGRIFHLWNNNDFNLVQMAALLEECGYGLKAVPPEKFAETVVVRAQDDFAQLFGVVRDVAENNNTPYHNPKLIERSRFWRKTILHGLKSMRTILHPTLPTFFKETE